MLDQYLDEGRIGKSQHLMTLFEDSSRSEELNVGFDRNGDGGGGGLVTNVKAS